MLAQFVCFLFITSAVVLATNNDETSSEEQTEDFSEEGAIETLRFTFEDNTYEIPPIKLPWITAKRDCQLLGMELVSVETEEEDIAIRAAISVYPKVTFWTSGNDIYQEGSFFWDSTGFDIGPYVHWGPDEPNNLGPEGQNCLSYRSNIKHFWDDNNCTNSHNFICESKPTECK